MFWGDHASGGTAIVLGKFGASDRVLVPLLCTVLWVQQHRRIYQQNYDENLQLTVTVVITNLRFLVDYSCKDYKFMLVVTSKHIDCDEKEGWSDIKQALENSTAILEIQ